MFRPFNGNSQVQAPSGLAGFVGGQLAAPPPAGQGAAAFDYSGSVPHSTAIPVSQRRPAFTDEVNEYLDRFPTRHSAEEVHRHLDRARDLDVLVVGDAIIDEYQYCTAIGKSSKEPTLVVKQLYGEQFAGGILAIANHAANFCNRVTLVTCLGSQHPQEEFIRSALCNNVEPRFLFRDNGPTITKRRFIDNYFFHKLFEVYDINDEMLEGDEEAALCAEIARLAPEHDVVVIGDFGHGMLTDPAIELLRDRAPFLAANAQANAGNMGFHTISKYARADYISTSNTEIMLESRSRHVDARDVLPKISDRLDVGCMAVTRGKDGSVVYSPGEGLVETPALADRVVDRVGAGDAFFALTSLLVVQDAPLEIVGLVGNIAGAQAVATVGNRRAIEGAPLHNQINTLLKRGPNGRRLSHRLP
jgi:bifunctional ADP-heptose synthase (sugar kinase/adenylyltransferase)